MKIRKTFVFESSSLVEPFEQRLLFASNVASAESFCEKLDLQSPSAFIWITSLIEFFIDILENK